MVSENHYKPRSCGPVLNGGASAIAHVGRRRGATMFSPLRFSVLLIGAFSLVFSSNGAASETGRSGDTTLEGQSETVQGMTLPSGDPDKLGARYQLAVVHRAAEVTCYLAGKKTARVRLQIEQGGTPKLVDGKVRWVQPGSGAEWSLATSYGGLVLTGVFGERGSPPSDVVLQFAGAKSLSLDAAGNLLIVTAAGDLHQRRPAMISTSAAPVTSKYVLLGHNRVAVEVWKQHVSESRIQHSVASLVLP